MVMKRMQSVQNRTKREKIFVVKVTVLKSITMGERNIFLNIQTTGKRTHKHTVKGGVSYFTSSPLLSTPLSFADKRLRFKDRVAV